MRPLISFYINNFLCTILIQMKPGVFYLLFLTATLTILHLWINIRQREPYMDELFHIPQAQTFCISVKEFRTPTYDVAITTPPGLYLPNSLLAVIISPEIVCSTRALRFTSAVMTSLTFVVISQIIILLKHRFPNTTKQEKSHYATSLSITLIPVSFFYSNLYYTDTSAIFYILLAWYLSLSNRHVPSAFVATIASFTRQTNIVWHFFIGLEATLYPCLSHRSPTFRSVIPQLASSLKSTAPHLVSGFLYLVFLFYNRGVAIGDRNNHLETIHYATLSYYSLFHGVFYMPFQLTYPLHPQKIFSRLRKTTAVQTTFVVSAALAISFVIATGDYAHPFVLSDNRHFIFYAYHRWLRRSTLHRLALVPLYVYAPISIHVGLLELPRSHRFAEVTLDFITLFSAGAVLVPNPLLELRYFVVPNLFLSIRRIARGPTITYSLAGLISTLYLIANIALVYLFTEMPFQRPIDPHMPHDLSPGRFML